MEAIKKVEAGKYAVFFLFFLISELKYAYKLRIYIKESVFFI